MPVVGSARFQGAGAASIVGGSPEIILANATSVYEVEANVNFATGTFTGQATNFQSTQPGITFSGSIPVTGSISGSGFNGSFNGSLGQQGTTVNYSGSVNGNFVGDNANGMVGTGIGVQSAPGFISQPVFNYWGAERQ